MSRGLYRQECCIIRGDDSIILGIMGNAMVGALQITFHSPRDVPSSCGTKEVKLRKSIYSQAKISVVSSKRSFHFKRKKMNPTTLNLKISKYSCILSKWQGSKIISPLSLHFMLYHFAVVNEMVILNTTVEI